MTQEDNKIPPIAILITSILTSGLGGVGTNFVMNDYKIEQIRKDIDLIRQEDKDLLGSIKSLTKIQNECVTSAKILEYRLKTQEKYK